MFVRIKIIYMHTYICTYVCLHVCILACTFIIWTFFYICQAYRHVLKGYCPSSEDAAIYLAGILLYISHGDYNKAMHTTEFLKYKFCCNIIMCA